MGAEENPVVKAALDLCEMFQIEAWRNQSTPVKGRRFNGRKGVADVVGLALTGVVVAIECKTLIGKPSAEQREFLEMVRARGGIAFVGRNPEWIAETLKYYREQGKI